MRNELAIALMLAVVGSTPAAATSLDVNLDFAAFNQSQWSPGPAVNEDVQYRFPDPYFGATADLARVSLDPVGTLLDFVGDFLGINLVTGISIAPTATFTTGFDAGYHVNSGSIDLSYPTQVTRSLPDQVNYGEACPKCRRRSAPRRASRARSVSRPPAAAAPSPVRAAPSRRRAGAATPSSAWSDAADAPRSRRARRAPAGARAPPPGSSRGCGAAAP